MARSSRRQPGAVWSRWKERAKQLKLETWTVYLAYRDPRTPWYARLVAVCVVGYALSPIDLVPDFIPILGYLDDLILVPLGLALALRMIPQPVLDECRKKAKLDLSQGKAGNWRAGLIVILSWLVIAVLAVVLVTRVIRP